MPDPRIDERTGKRPKQRGAVLPPHPYRSCVCTHRHAPRRFEGTKDRPAYTDDRQADRNCTSCPCRSFQRASS